MSGCCKTVLKTDDFWTFANVGQIKMNDDI